MELAKTYVMLNMYNDYLEVEIALLALRKLKISMKIRYHN